MTKGLVLKIYILLFHIKISHKESTMQGSHCHLSVPDKDKGRLFSVLHGSGASVKFSQWNPHWEFELLDKERNWKSVLPILACKFEVKETGDDVSQMIFIKESKVDSKTGRRDKKGHDRSERHFEVVAKDSASGVKKHSENSLRSNYCITYCQRAQGQMQYTGLTLKSQLEFE